MKSSPTFWLTVLIQINTAFIAIAVFLFMIIPKTARKEYFFLGAFLWFTLLNELVSTIGIHFFDLQMNIVINLGEFVSFFTLVMMYKKIIRLKNVNTIAYSIIVVHLMLGLTNFFFIQGPFHVNSYTWALSNTFIVAISLYYYYALIKYQPLDTNLRNIPMFWINFAMLINHFTTFFIYIYLQYLIDAHNSDLIVPLYFHRFLTLIFCAILWHALLLIRSDYRNRVFSI